MKIATKFAIAFLAGELVLLGLFGWWSVRRERAYLRSDAKRDVLVLGSCLRGLVVQTFKSDGQARVVSLLEESRPKDSSLRLQFLWVDQFPKDSVLANLSTTELEILCAGKEVAVERVDEGGKKHIHAFVPVLLGERIGAIVVSDSLVASDDYVRSTMSFIGALDLATIALSGLLALVLGTIFVGRPVSILVERTKRIGAGDFHWPESRQAKDELGQLSEAVKVMCHDLEKAQKRIAREYSKRLDALDQLRHADRLNTVGRLASGIAHELGTPLNTVIGWAGLISGGSLSQAEINESARTITAQCKRMTTIIRQLLDFARREHQEGTQVQMGELIHECLALITPMASNKSVEFIVQGDDGQNFTKADKGQLQQVFSNLLMNALDAMPEDGGTVTIEISKTSDVKPPDSKEATGSYLRIDVRDNGTGIPEDVLPYVFDPFFTTKDVGEGTGLGLSISHGIVYDHEGWMKVDSIPEKGTVFSVYLPQNNINE